MVPVRVEVLTRAPTEFFHCQHCEVAFHQVGLGQRFRADQRDGALPADLLAEFGRLSDWIADLVTRYGDRIQIGVVDVASIEGFLKALRYRSWRYPTIVADGEVIYRPGQPVEKRRSRAGDESEIDLAQVTRQIERRLTV